jgi:hypothetical protein
MLVSVRVGFIAKKGPEAPFTRAQFMHVTDSYSNTALFSNYILYIVTTARWYRAVFVDSVALPVRDSSVTKPDSLPQNHTHSSLHKVKPNQI